MPTAYVHVLSTLSDPVDLVSSPADVAEEVREIEADGVANERTAHVFLTDLEPNTEYEVYATMDGEESAHTTFKTAPETADAKVKFGITSCLGDKKPELKTLSHAATQKLDFMILAGDTVYADGDRVSAEFRRTWSKQLGRQSGLSDLLKSAAIVAVQDDHEIDDDWDVSNTSPAKISAGMRAFKEALPAFYSDAAPQAALEDDSALLYREFHYGPVHLIVLDTRSDRDPTKKIYISVAQMAWLKKTLSESKSKFKFIVNSIPITDFSDFLGPIERDNRWNHKNYREQRNEIIDFIDDNEIPGVIWLAGDFHFGGIYRVGENKRQRGYKQIEILSGPGGSAIHPFVKWRLHGLAKLFDALGGKQYIETIETWSWTQIEVDPATSTLSIKFFDEDGKNIWETELDVSEHETKFLGKGWSLFRKDADESESDSTDAANLMRVGSLILAALGGWLFML